MGDASKDASHVYHKRLAPQNDTTTDNKVIGKDVFGMEGDQIVKVGLAQDLELDHICSEDRERVRAVIEAMCDIKGKATPKVDVLKPLKVGTFYNIIIRGYKSTTISYTENMAKIMVMDPLVHDFSFNMESCEICVKMWQSEFIQLGRDEFRSSKRPRTTSDQHNNSIYDPSHGEKDHRYYYPPPNDNNKSISSSHYHQHTAPPPPEYNHHQRPEDGYPTYYPNHPPPPPPPYNNTNHYGYPPSSRS